MTTPSDTALDVWFYFDSPDAEEATYEANTYKNVDADGVETYRVEWYHNDVGQVTKVPFATYDEAKAWLVTAGYQDFSSGENEHPEPMPVNKELVEAFRQAMERAGIEPVQGTPEACRVAGLHLTSCDDDGFCNHCGHGPDDVDLAEGR